MAKSKNAVSAGPAMPDDYRAEDDHRTLMRAAEIKGDHARMKGVHRHHLKQRAALSKVGRTLGGRR